jgi:hypothetical protein
MIEGVDDRSPPPSPCVDESSIMRLARWLGPFGHLILRRLRGFAAHTSKEKSADPENVKILNFAIPLSWIARRDWHLSNFMRLPPGDLGSPSCFPLFALRTCRS